MADPTGAPVDHLAGVAAIIVAATGTVGTFWAIIRSGKKDNAPDDLALEVKAAVLDIRQDALDANRALNDAQAARIRQLERALHRHGIAVPPREDYTDD